MSKNNGYDAEISVKILVIAESSPELPTTWSGVPNHLVKALRAAGHDCETACYDRVQWIRIPRIFYNRIWRKVFHRGLDVAFDHSWLGMVLMSHWLRREMKGHQDVAAAVIMNYAFDATGVKVPVVMIHDWFTGYLKATQRPQELTRVERQQLAIQTRCVKSSAFSISLYPRACEWMRTLCGDRMRYICNPVNIDFEPDEEEWTRERLESKHILCIGGSYYRENVETVVRAVEGLEDIEVDVIGVRDVPHPPSVKVNFYGYLDKREPRQKAEYDRLLRQARCVVNVRSGWGGDSSIAEALYCYCPVIVGDYPDIVGMYGTDAKFGYYCPPADPSALRQKVKQLLDMPQEGRRALCRHAHETVRQHRYQDFVRALVEWLK